MYSALSSLWDATVRSSQVIEVRVDAYRSGVLVASDLPIDTESGTITVSSDSEVRRQIDLTIVDPTLVPTSASSVLTPHGTELLVRKGFRYPDGTTEVIPVGVFRIDKPTSALGGAAIAVTGVDRGRLLAEDLFINTAQSVTTNTVPAEITRLIAQTTSVPSVTDLTGNGTLVRLVAWEQGSSRWDAISEMALAIGAEVYTDVSGNFVIRTLPAITDVPDWTVDIGQTGVIIEGTESWDREKVYNAVTARSEPTDGSAAVQATVYDTNPASPTYFSGAFGHRPRPVYSSPLLTSVGTCTAAATTILARSIAPARTVTVSCVPNPALDAGDVVTLVLPGVTESDLPRSEKQLIRSIRLPLGLGAMELDLYTPDPTS